MASLRKIKNKWYVRITYNGKQKLIGTKAKTKRDAEIHLRSWQLNEQQVKFGIAESLIDKNLTIIDCINFFNYNYRAEKGITESTLISYQKALKDFQDCFLNTKNINELRKDNYSELVCYLNSKYSKTTCNIRLRSIRVFLNYLLEIDKIKKLPFKIKQIKIDQSPPKYLLPKELEGIYSLIVDKKLLATIKIFEITGMRVGELQHSIRDCNFIKITKTKTRKERIIPIADENIGVYDFARYDEPYSKDWISRSFSKYSRLVCKTRKTIHSLRHTFAYTTLLKTDNIQLVRDLLGHSNISTTEIYTQIPKEYLKQIFNDNFINKTQLISSHARA